MNDARREVDAALVERSSPLVRAALGATGSGRVGHVAIELLLGALLPPEGTPSPPSQPESREHGS